MKKILILTASLLCAGPALAQDGGFTTTNDVVNAMMHDWAEYDMACRGSSPSEADAFCGVRDYIAWSLGESGICIAEDEQTGVFFETCKTESNEFPDPLADIRETF